MKILLFIVGTIATILGVYFYINNRTPADKVIAGLFLITGSIAFGSAVLLLALNKVDAKKKNQNKEEGL